MSGRHFYLNIRDKLAQLLNPALCLSCGIPLRPSAYFCDHCLASLERVTHPCRCCGQPNPTLDDRCPACLYKPPAWQVMIAPLLYQGATRSMIQQLKFADHPELAEAHVARAGIEYYLEFNMAPMIRKLCKSTGFKLKEIYELFPSGPAKGACKVAGLPKPTGCV